MKWYSTLSKDPELEPHDRMQFSVTPFGEKVLLLCSGYSKPILSLTNKVLWQSDKKKVNRSSWKGNFIYWYFEGILYFPTTTFWKSVKSNNFPILENQ